MGEPTPIAVRGHSEPDGWAPRPPSSPRQRSRVALVLQTVPKPVEGEPLWFGLWELLHLGGPWMGAGRGVFHADDLNEAEIAELAGLCAANGWPEPISREEFVDTVFWRAAYRQELPVVGWFLPEDLGRLAVDWTEAGGTTADAISLILWTWPKPDKRSRENTRRRPVLANGEVEDPYRPRVVVRMLDGQRPMVSFTRRKDPDPLDLMPEGRDGIVDARHVKRGRFVTVQMLAFSLNDKRLDTLAVACNAFGLSLPDQVAGGGLAGRFARAVSEQAALTRLYRHLVEVEHERVAEGRLTPDKVFSQAAYGRAVLDAAGIEPPLARNPGLDRKWLGASMGGLFGGECAVSIRTPTEPLPCLFFDYSSLYPVVASLQQADRLLKADRLEVEDEDTAVVLAELMAVAIDDLLDPQVHARLAFRFVEVAPDGAWLPHRVPADKHWKMQVSELDADRPLTYPAIDLVRAIQDTGVVPRLVRAWRVIAHGRQQGLRPVALPSGRVVAPGEDLLFALAEQRLDGGSWRGAKPCANICCSGLYSQLDDNERTGKVLQHIHFADGRSQDEYGRDLEEPGRWYLPPLAASITAGARLMLHLARQLVHRAGGTVAYVDTDSLAIVATPTGGLIPCPGGTERDEQGRDCVRALSFEEIEQALAPLEALNPFRARHGDQAPRLLKLEADNLKDGEQVVAYLHARSTKNYDRYRLGAKGSRTTVEVTKASEHGLGHLHPHWQTSHPEPVEGWVTEGRGYLLRRDLGLPAKPPGWFDEMAVSILRLNRWSDLKPFLPKGGRKQRGNGPRPFSRIAVAHPDPLYAVNEDGERIAAAALWHDDLTPEQARWRDLRDGRPLRVRPTRGPLREADLSAGGPVPVKTMRDVFDRLAARHDHGLDHSGQPTTQRTIGLVRPAATRASLILTIGRETTDQDHVGTTADPAYRYYLDAGLNPWTLARDTLRLLASGTLGRGRPKDAHKPFLIRRAGELARAALAKGGLDEVRIPGDPVGACYLYLRTVGKLGGLCVCGRPLGKRERRWCPDCRPQRKRLNSG